MPWRVVATWCAWLVLGLALVLVAPVLWLHAVDEGAVPSASDAPRLPAGVTVAREELQCGSGGCYLVLTLTASGSRSAAELMARAGYPERVCAADGWLDRRRVCTQAGVRGDAASLVVQYDRSRWF